MELPKCATCAYWDRLQPPYRTPKAANSRNCTNPKLQEGFYEDDTDLLHYSYDEGGGFYTGPAFGCVHHTEAHDGSNA